MGDNGDDRLLPAEDHALRRLHWFEQLGCELSSALRTMKDGLRARDRRISIRDPYHAFDRNGAATPPATGQGVPKGAERPGYLVRPEG